MIQQQWSALGFSIPRSKKEMRRRIFRYNHPMIANTIEYVITQKPQGLRIMPFFPIVMCGP